MSRVRRGSSRPTLGQKLLLVALGTCAGLLVAEAALRVWEARRWRLPEKHYAAENEAEPVLRIALLGGSTADGTPFSDAQGRLDVPRSRQFHLVRLAQLALQDAGDSPRVVVDNFADGGLTAQQTIERFWQKATHKPDVVVLCTGNNELSTSYSINMGMPPRLLWPLGRAATGRVVLRWMTTEDNSPYRGDLFGQPVAPPFELEANRRRFRCYVEQLLDHCRRQRIRAVVVIPESNWLFPPMRSVYRGPQSRRQEVLRRFKEALKAGYLDHEPQRAREILEELAAICQFADLDFELGKMEYEAGHVDRASRLLRRARETDGFRTAITGPYQRILRELAQRYGASVVDVSELIRRELNKPVPDGECFFDDCHPRPLVHEAITRQLIRAIGGEPEDVDGGNGLAMDRLWKKAGVDERCRELALLWEAQYHYQMARLAFRRVRLLEQGVVYLDQLLQRTAGEPQILAEVHGLRQHLLWRMGGERQRWKRWLER